MSEFMQAIRFWVKIGITRFFKKKWRSFYSDLNKFVVMGGDVSYLYPIFGESTQEGGVASGHYFHQDLLVAKYIYESKPERHIDIGSRVDGFVAHVASYREIEVFDVRPLSIAGHSNIRFYQCDLMNMDSVLDACCDSISSLHALEHFGLGRYGDPLNPYGHIEGFRNLSRMLKAGGRMYISLPIGLKGVYFNAHRVFDCKEPISWNSDALRLIRFDYVDDQGSLHVDCDINKTPDLKYGCGIYTFVKV